VSWYLLNAEVLDIVVADVLGAGWMIFAVLVAMCLVSRGVCVFSSRRRHTRS